MSSYMNVIRDYLVLTTYQKEYQRALLFELSRPGKRTPLAMAQEMGRLYRPYGTDDYAPQKLAWNSGECRGVSLPTHLRATVAPVERVLRGDHSAELGSALERLSLVLKYTGGPLRWEPFNLNSQHRAAASPRSMFLCELRLAMKTRSGGVDVVRYLPDDHALAYLKRIDAHDTPELAGGLTFAIVGHLARCAVPYGEFSPVLVSVEAGLLSAQLRLMCAAVGWRSRTTVVFDDDAVSEALGLDHWSQIPLAILSVEDLPAPLTSLQLRADVFRAAEAVPPMLEMERFSAARELVRSTRLTDEPEMASLRKRLRARVEALPAARTVARDESAGEPDLLEVIRRRSSGCLIGGLAPIGREIDRDELEKLAGEWHRHWVLERANEIRAVVVQANLWLTHSESGNAERYVVDVSSGKLIGPVAQIPTERFAGLFYADVNFRELSFIATFTVDYPSELPVLERRAFFLVHQAAGELAQGLALTAARRGMFARPFRSYQELFVEPVMGLEGQVVLQVLCGFNRQCNPAMELG